MNPKPRRGRPPKGDKPLTAKQHQANYRKRIKSVRQMVSFECPNEDLKALEKYRLDNGISSRAEVLRHIISKELKSV